jgi:hypothetical protein
MHRNNNSVILQVDISLNLCDLNSKYDTIGILAIIRLTQDKYDIFNVIYVYDTFHGLEN